MFERIRTSIVESNLKKPDASPKPPFTIVYSALGRKHVREAAISAWSAKRHMPDIPTLLLTDEFVFCPYIDEVIVVTKVEANLALAKAAKLNKIEAIRAAPTQNVLYVDADTYFMGSVSEVFAAGRNFDIAAVVDTWQFPEIYRLKNQGLPDEDPSQADPYFNCGVIFARKNPRTMAFFEGWMAAFSSNPRIVLEQLVFREQIYKSGLRVHVLPTVYNARVGEPVHLSGRLKIAHRYSWAASDWQASTAFVADFLNSTYYNRIYLPREGRMVILNMDFTLEERMLSEYTAAREESRFLSPEVQFNKHSSDEPASSR